MVLQHACTVAIYRLVLQLHEGEHSLPIVQLRMHLHICLNRNLGQGNIKDVTLHGNGKNPFETAEASDETGS